jgi:hypothetical protein
LGIAQTICCPKYCTIPSVKQLYKNHNAHRHFVDTFF